MQFFLIFAHRKIYKYYTKITMAKELTSRKENYSQWYNDLVSKADLA